MRIANARQIVVCERKVRAEDDFVREKKIAHE